jgi:hypothetical protein
MADPKICKKCKKDHGVKNTGPLTVCEMNAYLTNGAPPKPGTKNGAYAFGTGERFQFPGAK